MRLLVCEFITGGGCEDGELPESLAREGEMMLQQLLRDLAPCPTVEHIDVLRDVRLPAISMNRCTSLPASLDFMATFGHACEQVDAVLPIAPESGGVLFSMCETVQASGSQLLNSSPTAIALTGSKFHTLKALAAAGIPCVPVSTIEQAARVEPVQWVIKPDDGVGGEGCRLLDRLPASLPENMVLQPLIEGTPASLILLCTQGDVALIAVNEQYIDLGYDGCVLQGVHVNSLAAHRDELLPMAQAIVSAVPGLWGWVGVDLILTSGGPLVLEINPRLTTAYAGLRQSFGCNPAEWLLTLADNGTLPNIAGLAPKPVEVMLA